LPRHGSAPRPPAPRGPPAPAPPAPIRSRRRTRTIARLPAPDRTPPAAPHPARSPTHRPFSGPSSDDRRTPSPRTHDDGHHPPSPLPHPPTVLGPELGRSPDFQPENGLGAGGGAYRYWPVATRSMARPPWGSR